MPGLVREMRVARHGVDLAIGGFELVVQGGQVLKLRGAHEREVGRVEKEDRPFAFEVFVRDRYEFAVVVGLNLEFGYR